MEHTLPPLPYAIDALANRIRLLLKAPPSGQAPAEAGLRAV